MMKKTVLPLLLALSVVMFLALASHAEPTKNAPAGKIDINTASADELTGLDGVGKAIAERIVEYRAANGPFKNPEDITKVKGIGPATWEKNKDKIAVGAPPAKQ